MSDFKFNCPHCQQPLEGPQEIVGTTINCPSCNGAIKLPDPATSQPQEAQPPQVVPLTSPTSTNTTPSQVSAANDPASVNDEPIRCPHCESSPLELDKTNCEIGGVTEVSGKKRIVFVCLKCGTMWKPDSPSTPTMPPLPPPMPSLAPVSPTIPPLPPSSTHHSQPTKPDLQTTSTSPLPRLTFSRLAIWSFILGLISLGALFVTGIPAVVTGHIALKRITYHRGRGLAIAGLLLGYFAIALSLFGCIRHLTGF